MPDDLTPPKRSTAAIDADTLPQLGQDDKGRQLVEYNGLTCRVLANGSLFDVKRSKIVTAPTRGLITSENAAAMAQKRVTAQMLAAREGMERGLNIPPELKGTDAAFIALMEHTTKTYAKSENLRGMGEVLSKIAALTGYNQGTTEDPKEQSPAEINTQGAAMVRLLLNVIKQVKDDDRPPGPPPIVIDAE